MTRMIHEAFIGPTERLSSIILLYGKGRSRPNTKLGGMCIGTIQGWIALDVRTNPDSVSDIWCNVDHFSRVVPMTERYRIPRAAKCERMAKLVRFIRPTYWLNVENEKNR